jgi:hypothetical protein
MERGDHQGGKVESRVKPSADVLLGKCSSRVVRLKLAGFFV